MRNFCIIAHIDHGKSTLADRLIDATETVEERKRQPQLLDSMDIERERGITIKAQTVRMLYRSADGGEYLLNLIDTPGHVDFHYEVSRSLAACEGALLVIDATQGVQAQTLANLYLALEHDLEIIPVINKIDLPSAEPDRVREQLVNLGIEPDEALVVSAKDGTGVPEVLEALVRCVPPPEGDQQKPLKALIFDSHFDSYHGVVAHIRVMEGCVSLRDPILLMASGKTFDVTGLGVFNPAPVPVDALRAGEVGFLFAQIHELKDARVGDTITSAAQPAAEPLAGYRPAVPMVYAGLYPTDTADYDKLREALERLQLNDAALSFEPETSDALGFGFRAGFLGLLHLEIVQERIEREFDLSLVTTAPNVVYRVRLTDGQEMKVENPAALPPPTKIEAIFEPMVRASIVVPGEYVGPAMELCQDRRGTLVTMDYPAPERVVLDYRMPLAEIMYDFFDHLKSRTRGYASLDYEMDGYEASPVVRVDILLNGERVDALSFMTHRDRAEQRGRAVCLRLKEIIPRQLFQVPIQASIGAKIIARETLSAMRKDVLAKCYGGDITRKRKLLEKQRSGKERMRRVGRVDIPQEAFMAVLQSDE